MEKLRILVTSLFVSLAIMVVASAAQGATLRAFVASTGNDANAATNCAQSAPCRTFAGAFPTVTAGGELIALDSSGYGPLTINKAITIATVPGATAFVVAAGGTAGFTVSAGATDLVVLRNINFNGSNAANTTGINLTSGRLEVHDCKLSQLTTGINIVNAKADLYNCILTGNTTAASVSGAGWDPNAASTPATALLTVSLGSITYNGTAFFMTNPGNSPKRNIWVQGSGSSSTTPNIAHTPTLVSGSGTGCPCFDVGVYVGTVIPH